MLIERLAGKPRIPILHSSLWSDSAGGWTEDLLIKKADALSLCYLARRSGVSWIRGGGVWAFDMHSNHGRVEFVKSNRENKRFGGDYGILAHVGEPYLGSWLPPTAEISKTGSATRSDWLYPVILTSSQISIELRATVPNTGKNRTANTNRDWKVSKMRSLKRQDWTEHCVVDYYWYE